MRAGGGGERGGEGWRGEKFLSKMGEEKLENKDFLIN